MRDDMVNLEKKVWNVLITGARTMIQLYLNEMVSQMIWIKNRWGILPDVPKL